MSSSSLSLLPEQLPQFCLGCVSSSPQISKSEHSRPKFWFRFCSDFSSNSKMSSIPSPIPPSGSKRPLSDDFNSTSGRPQKYQKNDDGSPLSGANCIQFFVRTISTNRPTLVICANADDKISSVLEKVESLTGVPLDQVRLIFQGKELRSGETLSEAKVQNDVVLHQVGRLKSSKLSSSAWEQVNDIIHHAKSLYRLQHLSMSAIERLGKDLKDMVLRFLIMASRDRDNLPEYLNLFSSCSGPQSLVMLKAFSSQMNAYFGGCCISMITHFIRKKIKLPEKRRYQCLPVVIELSMLLLKVKGINDNSYSGCRACMIELLSYMHDDVFEEEGLVFHHLIQYVVELAYGILRQLEEGVVMTPSSHMNFDRHVSDFSEFMIPVLKKLKLCVKLGGCFGVDFNTEACTLPGELAGGIIRLRRVFVGLLSTLEKRMLNVEAQEGFVRSHYLTILTELHSISQLYHGCEKLFWETMDRRNDDFCYLIITYVCDMKDSTWIQHVKRPSKFELRRDLALMMLPMLEGGREKYEMLIDRSDLLTASFHYIGKSAPQYLRAGLSMQFKDEEALGFGVIREWFLLACEALFNPEMGLFVACPNNRKQFFPNTESARDPLHLQYFCFSGRIIALALMHKVQVGVAFDRVFFLNLAGYKLSLVDIQDADPVLYSSYRKILEMDPAILDQDEMALTFTHEIERFGTRKVVELCPGGSSIAVNSKNRKQYVDFLINQRFGKAIRKQVDHFSQGFADLMGRNSSPKYFFRSLCPVDLDLMLHGDESEICVEDWRAHTDYHGFETSDDHISWFWKIVRGMSKEQKRNLLFFWTSVKYLPFQGFSGLDSRLSIIKKTSESTSESLNHHLPSSHTCFFQLCFPGYGSFNVMQDSFHKITQEDISCSFESVRDPLHLQYFRFSGRIIALALMHKVQVGVAFDHIFFLRLAGYKISLDDIQDADPVLYSSYRKILEMDPAISDQDEMALTFTHEIERFGTRKVVELCPGGSSIVVNSKNRKQYVDFLINQRFGKAIRKQVAHFSQGFADLMGRNRSPKYFFHSLCPVDLDLMLHGDQSEICVEDWRAHTDYHGFESSDDHISWFWKIVMSMSKEQKRTLLFFWTSVKYLPFKGFSGLDSRLSTIKKTSESTSESLHHHLPSSHTCFFQLCFPGYGSFNVMRDSFHKITQEDMSCSFE